MKQKIHLLGLSHKSAPVEIREKFALHNAKLEDLNLLQDQGPLSEMMILSTCNRVEILGVAEGNQGNLKEKIAHAWAEYSGFKPEELLSNTYSLQNLQAVEHIFTVASSLDSMVLGEPQILGQLKDAYRISLKQGGAKTIINRLLHKAFSVAKRIRTETRISQNAVSISYAAVELAKQIFSELEEKSVLLLGAGEMAELAAAHLLNSGVKKIYVLNRTYSRARELASHFQGEAVPFARLLETLPQADIVISSTGSSETILKAKQMPAIMKKRKNRPMFFIDIAVPRDMDPDLNRLDNIYLYDIDDLQEVVEENQAQRQQEAEMGQRIIQEEVDRFAHWLDSLKLNPTIVQLLDQGEELAQKELQKSLKRLGPDISPETRQAMETLAFSLSKKLYHHPITFLKRKTAEKEGAEYYLSLIRRIFDLDNEKVPENVHWFKKDKGES